MWETPNVEIVVKDTDEVSTCMSANFSESWHGSGQVACDHIACC